MTPEREAHIRGSCAGNHEVRILFAEIDRLRDVLKKVGWMKCVKAGNTAAEDVYERCWCKCLSDRCVDEPGCVEARAAITPAPAPSRA